MSIFNWRVFQWLEIMGSRPNVIFIDLFWLIAANKLYLELIFSFSDLSGGLGPLLQDGGRCEGAAQGQGEDQEEDQAQQVQFLSYLILSPFSYQRYKEETVEELSVESAPILPNFVMAETDRVTNVRCFLQLFLSLWDVIYVSSSSSFLIMAELQSHCGRDTIHFSLSPKMVVLIKIFY